MESDFEIKVNRGIDYHEILKKKIFSKKIVDIFVFMNRFNQLQLLD